MTCNRCTTGLGRSIDGCNQDSNTTPAPSFYTGSTFVACQVDRCSACSGNNAETCVSCIEGYYLDTNTCNACGSNCITCSSSTCTVCQKGYYKSLSDSKQCVLCPIDNCELCESATICKKCSSSYYLLFPGKTSCISSCSDPSQTANEGNEYICYFFIYHLNSNLLQTYYIFYIFLY